MRRALLVVVLALGVSCGRPPKPVVFATIDRERTSDVAARAKAGSPTLFAKAEGLRRRAEEAWARGDSSTAQLLAEHALATYRHAAVTARLTAAMERKSKAEARRIKAEEQLEADQRTLAEIGRDVDRLEAEIAVRKEALAPVASGKTDAAREAARWVATRANVAVATALCKGAELLAPNAKGVAEASKIAAELEAKAADGKGDAPIDASMRARALCLKALASARAVTVAGGGPAGDALLSELKDEGFAAVRDERGVVAVLPQVPAKDATFEGTSLTAHGKEALESLGKLAKAHPSFAVLVVVHAGPTKDAARDAARAKAASAALASVGVDPSRIGTATPGATLPANDPKNPKLAPANERLEIVFVGS